MRKTFLFVGTVLLSQSVFADSITDGIGAAGDAIYSYTPYVQYICYILAGVIGIVGAYSVYYAIANEARDIQKRIIRWGGGCLTMLCMSIALPSFFNYQQSGTLSGGGNGGMGTGTGDRFIGGDHYSELLVDIPVMSDPRWQLDPRYRLIK